MVCSRKASLTLFPLAGGRACLTAQPNFASRGMAGRLLLVDLDSDSAVCASIYQSLNLSIVFDLGIH